MLGKKKCRILKEIRQKIADENDIPYVTHECRFQGECKGTCPKCESELRYLEKQLAARAAAGKRIAIAALCAGMTFSAAGCSSPFAPKEEPIETDLSGAVDIVGGMSEPIDEGNETVGGNNTAGGGESIGGGNTTGGNNTAGGSETASDGENEIFETTGKIAPPDDIEEFELSGDVAYIGETDAR